ncbi:MAG: hypothetical protein WCA78_04935 [Rhizomicrobium sp.]|jgi:hypothetical protein
MTEAPTENLGWPGGWKYTVGAILLWAIFLSSLVAIQLGRQQGWPALALWVLALVPATTVAVQFVIAYRLIAGQDEFVRALTTKRMIIAAGLAITIATAWSVAELVGLPHLPAWIIYPLFWGLLGVVTPLVRRSIP